MRNRRRKRGLESKLVPGLRELKRLSRVLKQAGKKIVFTNGCFDLLHYGHAKYLQEAKQKGDILIVGINSDASVRSIKGKPRPLVNQKDRLRMVAALESVDYVVLFSGLTPYKVIQLIRPEVLIKGADWSRNKIVGSDIVLKYGGRVETVKFVPGKSTTNLIRKIARSF